MNTPNPRRGDFDPTIIVVPVLAMLVVCLVFGLCKTAYDLGYKSGQIDAANGTVKWHLTKNPDGSVQWSEQR